MIFMTVNFPFFAFVQKLVTGGALFPAFIPVALFFSMWCLITVFHKMPWYNAFLYPLQFTNLLFMATFYTVKFRIGPGVTWKGRVIT